MFRRGSKPAGGSRTDRRGRRRLWSAGRPVCLMTILAMLAAGIPVSADSQQTDMPEPVPGAEQSADAPQADMPEAAPDAGQNAELPADAPQADMPEAAPDAEQNAELPADTPQTEAPSSAETAVDAPRLICPEGEFLYLLYGFDGRTDVYDAEGRWHCSFHQSYPGPNLMYSPGKIRKTNYYEGTFLNFETGEEIGPFPSTDYVTTTAGDYLVKESITEQTTEICTADGTLIQSFPRTGITQYWIIDGLFYLLMQEGENIRVRTYDPAAGSWSELSGLCFKNADIYEFASIRRLGEYYLINGSNMHHVVTKNWDPLYTCTGPTLEDIQPLIDYQYEDVEIKDAYYFMETAEADGQETVRIRGRNLETVVYLPRNEWYGNDMTFSGPYLTGAPCEALDGRICAGLMNWGAQVRPYAREDGMLFYPDDGTLFSIQVPESETPEDACGSFLMTRGDENEFHVYNVRTGETVRFPEDFNVTYVHLGETGYVLHGTQKTDDEHFSILFNEEGQEIARTSGYMNIYPWINGMWYLRTGLSDGIIDENGSWLLRRWLLRD